MRSRADICRQKAKECERAAMRVADPQIQSAYRQMSRQWHEMAERQQAKDEALANAHSRAGLSRSLSRASVPGDAKEGVSFDRGAAGRFGFLDHGI
jgi:hypothetical protein